MEEILGFALAAMVVSNPYLHYGLLAVSSAALIAYPILEAKRDALVFPVKPNVSALWHRLGFIIRASLCITIIAGTDFILAVIPYAFFFSLVFDSFYNYFTDRSIFYHGTTAVSDRILGKYDFPAKLIGFLLTSLLLIFIKL